MKLIPTTSAIETAIKNAARDAKNYNLNDLMASEGWWLVVHKTEPGRSYIVDVNAGTCECRQFAEQGVCKHQRMVDEELEIRAMEEAQEAGEYLLECSREHLAGFTAEVLADTWAGWGA